MSIDVKELREKAVVVSKKKLEKWIEHAETSVKEAAELGYTTIDISNITKIGYMGDGINRHEKAHAWGYEGPSFVPNLLEMPTLLQYDVAREFKDHGFIVEGKTISW